MKKSTTEYKARIERLRLDMRNNLELFSKTILPHHTGLGFGEHHKDLFNILEDRNELRPRVVVLPRGHAKSTISTLIYPLHSICYSTERFIVIVSESYSQSVMFLEAIKDELEYNARLRSIFGNLVRREKWSEGEIETSNNIKIVAKGSGQRLRGLKYQNTRPTCIILDDFESEENTATEVLRDKLNRWIEGTVVPSIAVGGKIIFIGTIVHQASYLNRARYMSDEYRINDKRYWSIDGEDGNPIWPERWTKREVEALRNRYDKMGYLDLYYREYKNVPISPENRLFKPEYILYYRGEVLYDEMGSPYIQFNDELSRNIDRKVSVNIYIGVDPAMGKEKGDYTALMVVGAGTDGKIYVIEYVRERLTPMETIERIFFLHKKYKRVRRFAIESTAYQEALSQFLRQEALLRNIRVPIVQVKPRQGKVEKFADRLTGLEPLFRRNMVYIKHGMEELISELIDFPKGAHDDLLDSLWNSLYNVVYKTENKLQENNKYRKKIRKSLKRFLNWRVS